MACNQTGRVERSLGTGLVSGSHSGMLLRCWPISSMVWAAVESGIASPIGELHNEVADRVSDAAILIGAGYALGSVPELGFVTALLAVFLAYVRAQGKAVGGRTSSVDRWPSGSACLS